MLIVITGGGGYTGFHIGWKLCEGGHNVRLADIRPPLPMWEDTAPKVLYDALPNGFWGSNIPQKGALTFHKIDILDPDNVCAVLEGADGVIHTASFGVSGREQLSPHVAHTEKINLNGTQIVLEAAHKAQVKCLVFTSTYNVVFGGEEIFWGDENMRAFPLYKHVDHYSRTKAIAEMAVLAANGKLICSIGRPSTVNERCCCKTFRTCALRLNGIIGLGECRHLSRVITMLRSGFFLFTYGNREALVDFVGIQNVVQAHIKALFQLIKESEYSTSNGNIVENEENPNSQIYTSGNAFFISDGSPINNFEYFRPLIEGLGYSFPVINLPFQFINGLAKLQELLYCIVYKFYPFMPFVTPAEAFKTGITHYFRCDKANKAFGYKPTRPNDLSQVIKFYLEDQKHIKGVSRIRLIIIAVVIIYIISWLLL